MGSDLENYVGKQFPIVSIQLVSPASGETTKLRSATFPLKSLSFHSISFPSEWGVPQYKVEVSTLRCFHSISFPSEWGAHAGPIAIERLLNFGFHSISFPSEWGGMNSRQRNSMLPVSVSIQLVSPASGELIGRTN